MSLARWAAIAVLAASAAPAAAQTMLDQEQRLIDIHSLLLDLPAVEAPGALRAWQASLGVEIIGIPSIDGATGTKRQITASDRALVFPRPRLALGLPAPEGFRAFAGVSYIPPITISELTTHYGAAEVGFAWAPRALAVGLRAHVLYAESTAPVTDPNTRDTLKTFEIGAEVSAGWRFLLGPAALTPYAGVGLSHLHGNFRVTSDGVVLLSDYTGPALQGGLRVLVGDHWEAVGEVDGYPGRMVHPSFRLGYILNFGGS